MRELFRDVTVFDLDGRERQVGDLIDRPTIVVLVRYFG